MQGPDESADAALAEICQTYWRPVYVFIRGRGHAPADAEDLTQGFFSSLLERESLLTASADKGRLRTFFLTALDRYLINEFVRERRQQRGGGRIHIPIDTPGIEPCDGLTPELAFHRQWALTLLENVLAALRDEYVAGGRGDVFEALKGTLSCAGDSAPYAELAQKLGKSEGAIKVAAHRLRQRYAHMLRKHIAGTVDSDDEVEDEIRSLFAAFSTPSGPGGASGAPDA
jgi:DNA-directed RNA polymerase specialized sigma24 family protein